jgi:serine/threonine protein kinase
VSCNTGQRPIIYFNEFDQFFIEKIEEMPVETSLDPDEMCRIVKVSGKNLFIVKYESIQQISERSFRVVMEKVNGVDLFKFLTQRNLSYYRIKLLIFQILNGFKCLHGNSILHRDVCISNILMVKSPFYHYPKISDINFYRPCDENQILLANPEYLDPCVNKFYDYDLRSEIWSIGVLLYHILTAKCPFGSRLSGDSVEIIRNNSVNNAPDLRLIPSEFKVLVSRCLNKDKELRPNDLNECVAILSQHLDFVGRTALKLATGKF